MIYRLADSIKPGPARPSQAIVSKTPTCRYICSVPASSAGRGRGCRCPFRGAGRGGRGRGQEAATPPPFLPHSPGRSCSVSADRSTEFIQRFGSLSAAGQTDGRTDIRLVTSLPRLTINRSDQSVERHPVPSAVASSALRCGRSRRNSIVAAAHYDSGKRYLGLVAVPSGRSVRRRRRESV